MIVIIFCYVMLVLFKNITAFKQLQNASKRAESYHGVETITKNRNQCVKKEIKVNLFVDELYCSFDFVLNQVKSQSR